MSLFSPASQSPEVKREKAELLATAPRGKDGHPLAPNGQRSNLTEDQWATVRTRNFKRWFGDWELLSHRMFLQGPPVASSNGSEFNKLGDDLVDAVLSFWNERGLQTVTHPMFGSVNLGKSGIKDSWRHGRTAAKASVFAILHEIIPAARIVLTQANYKGGTTDRVILTAPIMVGGNESVAVVILLRDANTRRLYLHDVWTKEEVLSSPNNGTDQSQRPGASSTPLRSIIQRIFAVNPENVSKVTDENGEPLEVFHGTYSEFDSFKGYAFFFFSNPRSAAQFATIRAAGRGGERVVHAFLSLKDPVHEDLQGVSWQEMEDRLETAFQEGDSAIFDNVSDAMGDETQYIAFRPNQIKSSTANNGQFSDADSTLYSPASQSLPPMPKRPEGTAFDRAAERVYGDPTKPKGWARKEPNWEAIHDEEAAKDTAYERELEKWISNIPERKPITFKKIGQNGTYYYTVTRNTTDPKNGWRTTYFGEYPRPDWTLDEEIEYEDLFKKTRWVDSRNPEWNKWNDRLFELGSRPIVEGTTRIVPTGHDEKPTRLAAVMHAMSMVDGKDKENPVAGALFSPSSQDAFNFDQTTTGDKQQRGLFEGPAIQGASFDAPFARAEAAMTPEQRNANAKVPVRWKSPSIRLGRWPTAQTRCSGRRALCP